MSHAWPAAEVVLRLQVHRQGQRLEAAHRRPRGSASSHYLASQFGRAGTEGLETPEILNAPEVRRAGGLETLKLFRKPAVILMDTKERIFAA